LYRSWPVTQRREDHLSIDNRPITQAQQYQRVEKFELYERKVNSEKNIRPSLLLMDRSGTYA